MRAAYLILILLATFSAFTLGMAAGMQLAGINGAKFPFPFALGPSWTWFWADAGMFACQIGIIVYASYKVTALPTT